MHTCIRARARAHTHTHTHTHTNSIHTYIHTYMHKYVVCIHLWMMYVRMRARTSWMDECIYVYVNTHIYIHIVTDRDTCRRTSTRMSRKHLTHGPEI